MGSLIYSFRSDINCVFGKTVLQNDKKSFGLLAGVLGCFHCVVLVTELRKNILPLGFFFSSQSGGSIGTVEGKKVIDYFCVKIRPYSKILFPYAFPLSPAKPR